MTNREFLTNIANGTMTQAEIDFAAAAIVKLDEANEKRKNKKPSAKDLEKAKADEAIRESILATLTSEFQTEGDIAEAVGVTGPKARAELRKLVEAGTVEKGDLNVPKKGKCKGYRLADTVADEETSDEE
jgi:hypothetical protein